jgi:hypothetical protein
MPAECGESQADVKVDCLLFPCIFASTANADGPLPGCSLRGKVDGIGTCGTQGPGNHVCVLVALVSRSGDIWTFAKACRRTSGVSAHHCHYVLLWVLAKLA